MKKTVTRTQRIVDDIWLLPGAHAIMQITDERRGGSAMLSASSTTGKIWANWGEDNLLPDYIVRLIYNNNLKPELINTTIDFLIGKSIRLYKEEILEGKIKINVVRDTEIETWLQRNEIDKWRRAAGKNLKFFGNTFTEFVLTNEGKVYSIQNKHCNDVRAEIVNKTTGRIENYYLCGDWSKAKYDPKHPANNNVIRVPAYDPDNPALHPKFVYHAKDEIPGQPYYSIPNWLGTKAWTELANEIPKWHLAGIKNGYVIRWHIKIPRSYFEQYGDKAEEKEQEVREQMNQWLSGTAYVGKAFASKYSGEPDKSGWIIEPIKAELHDEAFTQLFEQSNQANVSGHGIHLVLAGIEQAGKLSSGSEMRLAYQIYLALKTPTPRSILLEPLEIAKKLNGWDPEIKFGIEDIDITTLDKNPTGTQTVMI